MGFDCKCGIEQEYALIGEIAEVAGRRNCAASIGRHFLKNIQERRRHGYPRRDTKAQAVCLSRAMIGVLADNHDLDLVEGTVVECGEYA